jgi:hypothetical protein
MSITPQGISIQTAYRWYRDGRLIINRQYQRKLVWTIAEKQRLIDSLLKDYPLPLFLIAERAVDGQETTVLEVIDGMQRLNAIFGFIENVFLVENSCFDIKEFSRARQLAEAGVFTAYPSDTERLDAARCANILDYQLAMTIFPGEEAARIANVFGRVNSGGKQLSDQERRQAGVLSPFAELVRELAAEIRGDVSRGELPLTEMPEISIETTKNVHGYTLKAEEIFWCYQGILRTTGLRDSEDEQVLADILASILYAQPVEASGEYLNKIYDPATTDYSDINAKLIAFPRDALLDQVKKVFSVVREVIETSSSERFHFRDTIYEKQTSNAQKQAFYAVFMAFYSLIMNKGFLPSAPEKIMPALNNLSKRIHVGQKHVKTTERAKNIKVVTGLVLDCFAKGDVASLGHGPGVAFDFENSIRRSRTETARYEFKQGILRLDQKRERDPVFMQSLIETICGIANAGPDSDGFIYVGIADKPADAARVATLDKMTPLKFEHIEIVGIDREAKILGIKLDAYVKLFENAFSSAQFTEPLKTQVRAGFDVVTIKGLSVLRIRVPKQSSPSFLADECFFRAGSSTIRATGPQIAAISKQFAG